MYVNTNNIKFVRNNTFGVALEEKGKKKKKGYKNSNNILNIAISN